MFYANHTWYELAFFTQRTRLAGLDDTIALSKPCFSLGT